MNTKKKILIIGGVAGGASAAARARRLCEDCEIIIFDKGPFVSFANCGLPYFVGNVIKDEDKLLVASPELFKNRFNIEARTQHEVISINRQKKEVEVRDLINNVIYNESYTDLVLSPGAKALKPPIPGIDLPGVFSLRTIPDSKQIISWVKEKNVKTAAIVGGGFIGLEMAENLSGLGINVSLIDLADQVMPPLDKEMSFPVESKLIENNIDLFLGDSVTSFLKKESGLLELETKSGNKISVDMVILAIGVRPDISLAEDSQLSIGSRGGIEVDDYMQTNDSSIWAVGDAVEVTDYILGTNTLIPLAGPANRQGRIAADNIFGRNVKFRGVQGTAVCGSFGLTIAMTGASEKSLRRSGVDNFEQIYLHPGNHVGYYPGSKPIHIKLLFDKLSGIILGAQAIGESDVARRIDVISMAIQKDGTVFDLEESELCYAPQFGAAKDPINLAGMIASNVVRGDLSIGLWDKINDSKVTLVDVREPHEFQLESIPGSINIPLTEMRDRIDELKELSDINVYCVVGQRGYYATRLLKLNGIEAKNLSGGINTWKMISNLKKNKV